MALTRKIPSQPQKTTQSTAINWPWWVRSSRHHLLFCWKFLLSLSLSLSLEGMCWSCLRLCHEWTCFFAYCFLILPTFFLHAFTSFENRNACIHSHSHSHTHTHTYICVFLFACLLACCFVETLSITRTRTIHYSGQVQSRWWFTLFCLQRSSAVHVEIGKWGTYWYISWTQGNYLGFGCRSFLESFVDS